MEQDVKLALLLLGFNEEHTPSKEELAQSFRASSMRFHPDMGGSVELFRALTLARDIVQAHLPEPKKHKETHTESKTYTSYDAICAVLRAQLNHQASMAVLNLSQMSRKVKKITLHAESIGTLTITCRNTCDVKDVFLAQRFHNNQEVLKLFIKCLEWVSTKPRKCYKQDAFYELNGKRLAINFSFKYESFFDYFKF